MFGQFCCLCDNGKFDGKQVGAVTLPFLCLPPTKNRVTLYALGTNTATQTLALGDGNGNYIVLGQTSRRIPIIAYYRDYYDLLSLGVYQIDGVIYDTFLTEIINEGCCNCR